MGNSENDTPNFVLKEKKCLTIAFPTLVLIITVANNNVEIAFAVCDINSCCPVARR